MAAAVILDPGKSDVQLNGRPKGVKHFAQSMMAHSTLLLAMGAAGSYGLVRFSTESFYAVLGMRVVEDLPTSEQAIVVRAATVFTLGLGMTAVGLLAAAASCRIAQQLLRFTASGHLAGVRGAVLWFVSILSVLMVLLVFTSGQVRDGWFAAAGGFILGVAAYMFSLPFKVFRSDLSRPYAYLAKIVRPILLPVVCMVTLIFIIASCLDYQHRAQRYAESFLLAKPSPAKSVYWYLPVSISVAKVRLLGRDDPLGVCDGGHKFWLIGRTSEGSYLASLPRARGAFPSEVVLAPNETYSVSTPHADRFFTCTRSQS